MSMTIDKPLQTRRSELRFISRRTARSILPLSICAIIVLIVLAPLLWAIVTALKSEVDAVAYPPTFWPSPISFENFLRVLSGANFTAELLNSVYYSVGSVLLSMLVAAPAG